MNKHRYTHGPTYRQFLFSHAMADTTCPKCGCSGGFYCETPQGKKVVRPHKERLAQHKTRLGYGPKPTKEKVQALASNVNSLIENYQAQQQNTAKLFEICLEFLDEKQTGHGMYISNEDIQRAGGVFKAERAALIKRRERKQQLIAAIKGYIKMINEREKKDENQSY